MTAAEKLNDHESGHAWPWREVERLQRRIDCAQKELEEALQFVALTRRLTIRRPAIEHLIETRKRIQAAMAKLRNDP